MTTYIEKLRDPRWQKKRLLILERDRWQCQSCGNEQKTLNVHHKIYLPNKDPWDYSNSQLITLCEACHDTETKNRKEIDILFIQAVRTHLLGEEISILTGLFNSLEQNNNYDPETLTGSIIWALKNHSNMYTIMRKIYDEEIVI